MAFVKLNIRKSAADFGSDIDGNLVENALDFFKALVSREIHNLVFDCRILAL